MKVADMHCDTISRMDELGRTKISLGQNELHIDLEKMKKGNYLLQNFALFIDKKGTKNPYEKCENLIEYYHQLMNQYKNDFLVIERAEDIDCLLKSDKIGSLLTMEEGAPLEGSIEKLTHFYEQGVRMLALTWNYPNEIGYPNVDCTIAREEMDLTKVNIKDGLTERGKEIVREMEKLGMIIDVSHGSDALFWDVLQETKNPFVASHSNARSICNVARNLSDEMIRALSVRGGVMGMNFCTDFVKENGNDKTYIKDIIRHIKKIYQVGGIECIGWGSDFDGIGNKMEWNDASGMGLFYDELKKANFTETEVEKIFYKNVLRIYQEIL